MTINLTDSFWVIFISWIISSKYLKASSHWKLNALLSIFILPDQIWFLDFFKNHFIDCYLKALDSWPTFLLEIIDIGILVSFSFQIFKGIEPLKITCFIVSVFVWPEIGPVPGDRHGGRDAVRPPRPDRARRLHTGCRGLQAGHEPLPPAQAAR